MNRKGRCIDSAYILTLIVEPSTVRINEERGECADVVKKAG